MSNIQVGVMTSFRTHLHGVTHGGEFGDVISRMPAGVIDTCRPRVFLYSSVVCSQGLVCLLFFVFG